MNLPMRARLHADCLVVRIVQNAGATLHLTVNVTLATGATPDGVPAGNVTFKDGSSSEVSTIVWANGYQAEVPFLDPGTISWIDGQPARVVGGLLSPDAPNLYYNGWVSAIGSSSQLYSSSADIIAKMISAQERIEGSLYEQIFSDEQPSGKLRFDLFEWRDILVAADRRLSAVLGVAPPSRREIAQRYPWARRRLSVF